MRLDLNVSKLFGGFLPRYCRGLIELESSDIELTLTSFTGNNCLRGNFICTGYQQRSQWRQIKHERALVPLLSPSEYESSSYAQSSYNFHYMGARREPLRVDPQHRRPLGVEDDCSSASTIPSASTTSSENNRFSTTSCAHQPLTPVSDSNSAHPSRQLKNAYEGVSSLHNLSRQEPSQDSEGGIPRSAQSFEHSDSPYSNPQVAAQLALSNLASQNRLRTQKEEMLAGHHYFPFDEELILERERCSRACWRFNSSTNPNNGVSLEERARLFRDILQPRKHVISQIQAAPGSLVGRVGNNLVIEGPFHCDYGYNINIGQDVAIGRNCTILDTCEVKIGDRCNIGPNVNIYTTILPIDSEQRRGSRGPNLGRKVTIDTDCWIGGDVTILPGRTIGQGNCGSGLDRYSGTLTFFILMKFDLWSPVPVTFLFPLEICQLTSHRMYHLTPSSVATLLVSSEAYTHPTSPETSLEQCDKL